jgi:chemotaxis protein CheC
MSHLTADERDILIEVASMGAGHATRPIAQLIGERIDVNVPTLDLVTIEDVSGLMGGAEDTMTIVAIKIKGEIAGTILLLVTPENATKLLSNVQSDQETSVLEEIANILAGAALGAISRFLGLTLMQSVPGSATDMLQAMIGEITTELAAHANEILVLGIDFSATASHATGKLYFLFTPTSTQHILKIGHAKLGSDV